MKDLYNKESRNEYIRTILSVAIESANKPEIILHEVGKTFKMRSQLHVLVVMPFGTGKSTLAKQIPNSYYLTDYTTPGMLGTINQEGDYVKGALINAANKVLVVDEGQKYNAPSFEAMKSMLEDQTASRSLGYSLKKPISLNHWNRDGYSVKSNKSENGFKFKCRFSSITFAEYLTPQMKDAWLSRQLFIFLRPTLDDVFELAKGMPLLDLNTESLLLLINNQDPLFKKKPLEFEGYLDFVKEYESKLLDTELGEHFNDDNQGSIARNIHDLSRIAAFYARLERSTKIVATHTERSFRFLMPSLYSIVASKLTKRELQVLERVNFTDLSKKEIGLSIGIDEGNLSKLILRLRVQKLIFREV